MLRGMRRGGERRSRRGEKGTGGERGGRGEGETRGQRVEASEEVDWAPRVARRLQSVHIALDGRTSASEGHSKNSRAQSHRAARRDAAPTAVPRARDRTSLGAFLGATRAARADSRDARDARYVSRDAASGKRKRPKVGLPGREQRTTREGEGEEGCRGGGMEEGREPSAARAHDLGAAANNEGAPDGGPRLCRTVAFSSQKRRRAAQAARGRQGPCASLALPETRRRGPGASRGLCAFGPVASLLARRVAIGAPIEARSASRRVLAQWRVCATSRTWFRAFFQGAVRGGRGEPTALEAPLENARARTIRHCALRGAKEPLARSNAFWTSAARGPARGPARAAVSKTGEKLVPRPHRAPMWNGRREGERALMGSGMCDIGMRFARVRTASARKRLVEKTKRRR